ncbi:MAG: hypothetical protein JWQ06_1666 [Mucilaginibacter sp.]|nr:hypothetical protein [Mucilaginibacter sp.]
MKKISTVLAAALFSFSATLVSAQTVQTSSSRSQSSYSRKTAHTNGDSRTPNRNVNDNRTTTVHADRTPDRGGYQQESRRTTTIHSRRGRNNHTQYREDKHTSIHRNSDRRPN